MPKRKTDKSIKERKEDFLIILAKYKGILTPSMLEAHITYTTYKKWFQEDEKFRKQVLAIDDIAVDHVESKLMELIDDKNPTAILFYLKCRRHEKWNDRNTIQIEGKIDHNIKQIQINVLDMDTKLLMENTVKLLDDKTGKEHE